jgi:hypothetical protein
MVMVSISGFFLSRFFFNCPTDIDAPHDVTCFFKEILVGFIQWYMSLMHE